MSYLLKRGNRYYLRYQIPGQPRREISLRTNSPNIAHARQDAINQLIERGEWSQFNIDQIAQFLFRQTHPSLTLVYRFFNMPRHNQFRRLISGPKVRLTNNIGNRAELGRYLRLAPP